MAFLITRLIVIAYTYKKWWTQAIFVLLELLDNFHYHVDTVLYAKHFPSTITLVNNPQYYLSRSDFVASTSSPPSLRVWMLEWDWDLNC